MTTDIVTAVKEAMPESLQRSVTPELATRLHDLMQDPDMHESYRENLLSYASIMQEGKFKVSDYINAVTYISQKLRGCTNKRAYELTFPEKVADWNNRAVSLKDQSSYIAMYNKTKLVNRIMEQTIIPSWVLNQDLYQKALNTQAELMIHSNSDKVRTDAANSLLTHLKPPETAKVEIDVTAKGNSAIDALRDATMSLVEEQRKAIASGTLNAQEVAHSKVISGTAERVD